MGRTLGLSEAEFWDSTPAKIQALRKSRAYLDRRRDHFVARLIHTVMAAVAGEEAESTMDILSSYYPQSVIITPFNDALGAQVDPQLTALLSYRGKRGA